jgi:hypothetical protein
MDIVSFETAKKLKEAGFPQPEPAVGQVWYNEIGFPSLLTRNMGEGEWRFVLLASGEVRFDLVDFGRTFFAPTATDILPLLGESYGLNCEGDGWQVFWMSSWGYEDTIAEHANPAEACAAAWLKNKQQ